MTFPEWHCNNIFFYLVQAAILQQTADYIYQLEQERKDLLNQNSQLKKILQQDSMDGKSTCTLYFILLND